MACAPGPRMSTTSSIEGKSALSTMVPFSPTGEFDRIRSGLVLADSIATRREPASSLFRFSTRIEPACAERLANPASNPKTLMDILNMPHLPVLFRRHTICPEPGKLHGNIFGSVTGWQKTGFRLEAVGRLHRGLSWRGRVYGQSASATISSSCRTTRSWGWLQSVQQPYY